MALAIPALTLGVSQMIPLAAWAATGVGTNSTVSLSNQGTNDIALQGGTLKIDKAGSYSNNISVQSSSVSTVTSTIDVDGTTSTLSGVLANDSDSNSFPGALIINDSVGGGRLTLAGTSSFTGATTINAGATLAIAQIGSISSSTSITDNGTLDISQTSSGTSITSLAGAGSVVLGAQSLRITNGANTFTGVISGSGGLIIAGGTQVLSNTNTYTGGTTVTRGTLQLGDGESTGMVLGDVAVAGTLAFDRVDDVTFDGLVSGSGALSQLGTGILTLSKIETYSGATTVSAGTLALGSNGNISSSSTVGVDGTFDISATAGTAIKSLSGTGTVNLGAATLTLTSASGTFSGVVTGSGGVVLNGGTEILSGANTYTGPTTVNAGTLEIGTATFSGNVTDNGTFGFYSSGTIAMSGVVSGTGALVQAGTGTTTISTAQSYTGVTTISGGTLVLSGAGSIATSSGLVDNGAFAIGAVSGGASITTLSGSGSIDLGANNLTLTGASGTFTGSISGSGGLILASGKETLSGSSTYTGATTISGGTLYLTGTNVLPLSARIVDNGVLDISGVTSTGIQTTSSIASLSGTGAVALGSATLVLNNAGDTFSGSISGSGGVTVAGGTQTFTGANSFTGTTTIKGGASLVLAGSASLANTGTVSDSGTFDISAITTGGVAIGSLSGSGMLLLGGNTLTVTSAATSFSGSITGTGGLTVAGGTQALAGSSSYTGGTTVSGGATLQLGNGLTNGSIVGNIVDNGTVAFNQLSATTFAGIISGSGGVLQNGVGTVALTAANTYTGGTTISAGTLQIGNGGTTGSIVGDVTDNGTLAFDRSDAITFGGTISGTGGVSQLGGNILTLTAVNTYSGTTSIDSTGTLRLSSTGSIAASSDVIDNGVLDLSAAGTTPKLASLGGNGIVTLGAQTLQLTAGSDSFSGAITGSGGLTVSGGTQTLSGTSSYTGPTTITGGALAVTGSIASSSGVAIGAGGTLAGSGAVPSVQVGSGGTLAPGLGALNVAGNTTFASGSTYQVSLSSTSSSKLVVSGAASLAGTVSVVSTDGSYLLGQKITILTAGGGLSGSFGLAPLASQSGAQYAGKLSYDSTNAYLEIDLAKLSPALASAATANQVSVVKGIDAAIAANNSLPAAFNGLGNLSQPALGNAADQLSGEIGSDVARAGRATLDPFLNSIFDHLSNSRSDGAATARDRATSGTRVWISGISGSDLGQGDSATLGSHKFKSHITGFVAGLETAISPSFTVGGAVSAVQSSFHAGDSLGEGSSDTIQVAGYAYKQFSRKTYGSFAAVVALGDVKTDRILTVSGTDALKAKVSTLAFSGRYETGIKLGWITPYLAVQDTVFNVPGYGETAAAGASTFALNYQSQTTNTADLELGVRQSADIPLGRFWTLKLTDRLGLDHDFSGRPASRESFVALSASTFTAYGAATSRDAALISFGARLTNLQGLTFGARIDSQVGAKSQTYTGIADLGFRW
jgi:autotransporter-associated beta strand protein